MSETISETKAFHKSLISIIIVLEAFSEERDPPAAYKPSG